MLTLTRYDEATDTEVEVEFEYSYSEGRPNHFSHSFGNWLPGDPEEFEVTSAEIDGRSVELTEDELGEAQRIAMGDMVENAMYAAEDAAEARAEAGREDYYDRHGY